MRHGACKFNMPHAFTTHDRPRYLNPAFFTDDPFIPDPFVFAAIAFVVLFRTEDALVKQAAALTALGAIVDGLWLGHLAMRPIANLLGGRKFDYDRAKIVFFVLCFHISLCF